MRNLLVNVNSAVNFILYCAVGQKFRRVFLQTFCQLTRCGDISTVQTDLPSTPGPADYTSRRMMRRGPQRRWTAAGGVQMQAIDSRERCRTTVFHPCDHHSSADN